MEISKRQTTLDVAAGDSAVGEPPTLAVNDELGSTRIMTDAERMSGVVQDAILYAQLPPSPLPRDMSILGEFQLLKRIGDGAMGMVYLARQANFDRDVALKILYPHIARSEFLVDRFYHEGLIMGQLDHPNMIQAYGVGEIDDYHYVAMEYVEGQSLQSWLTKLGRLSVGDALHVGIACARALEYAHALGIIHRDIKPDNVMITKDGVVKVADLGMLKSLDQDMSLTQNGQTVGTPWYMPLEQAKNAREADERSDIYALGCMLYCLLVGNPPFNGPSIVEVLKAKELGTYPSARSRNPEVTDRLDLILNKMLHKSPKYRYRNCTNLLKDLEGLGLANAELFFVEAPEDKTEISHSVLPSALIDTVCQQRTEKTKVQVGG